MKTTIITIFISIILGMVGSFSSAAIIIDHNCTQITQIPKAALEQAKANLHIAYGHTSHGSQLTTGMAGLVVFANNGGLGLSHPENFFQWNNGGTGGALDLHDYAMEGDCGYYPEWVNNTVGYLGDRDPDTGRGTINPDVNVIIWSWCGQVDDKFVAGTLDSEYLTPMANLEVQYPGVTFVYMTGHVAHWNDANNKAANQMIRDFCSNNEKILYDFADIESYDPDGTYYEFPHDNCDYYESVDGPKLGNWAIEWQNSHTQNVDWYDCPSAHSEPLNANQKAYAAWWLWARIAGWNPDGNEDGDGDGYTANDGDCNDNDGQIHPGAIEVCNGEDDNCDGSVDEELPVMTYYRDADDDGYGDMENTITACSQPQGYVQDSGDCNDGDASIHPGAAEICGDGIDQDCSGSDLACPLTWYLDADGDGYGDHNVSTDSIEQPDDYVPDSGDCNDGDASIHPDAAEICGDGIDQDCNGSDLACPLTWYMDADGDGYGDHSVPTDSIEQPDDYVPDSSDCNDGDASIHPGAAEICGDGIDQDCSGSDLACEDDDGDDPGNSETIQAVGSDETISFVSSAGTVITECQAVENPSPLDTPADIDFPYGVFQFTIGGVAPGGSTVMTITLPEGETATTYYKYGPIQGKAEHHWYEFMYDGETGAVINGNIITLHFIDGERGDSDMDGGNGQVFDPGAPAVAVSDDNSPAGSSGGTVGVSDDDSGCFIGIISLEAR